MTGYLVRVLSVLRERSIPAMPFKGPVLSITLYNDSSLRSFGDIDVLIQRRHLIRAVKVLASQGFLPPFPLKDQQLLKLSKTDNEFPKHKKMTIGGEAVSIFYDEDLLFYLCVHGNQHTWKQLAHVCCVAGLIANSPNLDWDAVFLAAPRYRGLRMLLIGLLLAQDLFDTLIPGKFSIRLQKDSRAVELALKISQNLSSSA